MKGFWAKLPKPFFVQAPLANVTDAAFRRLIATYGKPDVMYTEFVSADGLVVGNRELLLRDLMFTDSERPIVAQFFTGRPEMMEKAAALAADLGFDGVDINMGCPDKSVERAGGGAALIKNPRLAADMVEVAKRGARNLPISIKTRLGYNKDILEEWLPALLEAKPAAIALHARTRKEMSKVPAHWDRVKRAVEIRDAQKSKTLIIGNGDLVDLADAREKIKETGADGVMLGKALFGCPWLFGSSKSLRSGEMNTTPTPPQRLFASPESRLRVMAEHAKLFEELLGDVKNFAIMKKHFKTYAEGFSGAKELRMRLMETNNAAEVEEIVEGFILESNG